MDSEPLFPWCYICGSCIIECWKIVMWKSIDIYFFSSIIPFKSCLLKGTWNFVWSNEVCADQLLKEWNPMLVLSHRQCWKGIVAAFVAVHQDFDWHREGGGGFCGIWSFYIIMLIVLVPDNYTGLVAKKKGSIKTMYLLWSTLLREVGGLKFRSGNQVVCFCYIFFFLYWNNVVIVLSLM